MPRIKNEKDTFIYWLVDIRPETISSGWSNGRPFYCGKTIRKPEYRLKSHCWTALRSPRGRVSKVLLECGDHVRIQIMEIVPPSIQWQDRERRWIQILRDAFPDTTNIAAGGEGAPGHIKSAETRHKMSLASKGKVVSQETRQKMRLRMLGNPIRKGKLLSPEGRARLSVMRTGVKRKPHSEETKRKIRDAQVGKPRKPEHIESMKAAWVRRKARMRVDSMR